MGLLLLLNLYNAQCWRWQCTGFALNLIDMRFRIRYVVGRFDILFVVGTTNGRDMTIGSTSKMFEKPLPQVKFCATAQTIRRQHTRLHGISVSVLVRAVRVHLGACGELSITIGAREQSGGVMGDVRCDAYNIYTLEKIVLAHRIEPPSNEFLPSLGVRRNMLGPRHKITMRAWQLAHGINKCSQLASFLNKHRMRGLNIVGRLCVLIIDALGRELLLNHNKVASNKKGPRLFVLGQQTNKADKSSWGKGDNSDKVLQAQHAQMLLNWWQGEPKQNLIISVVR